MSREFDSYLDKLPIHVIKLTDGSTIIAKFIEDDGEQTLLAKPMELQTLPLSSGKNELVMQEWLYGCSGDDVIINNYNILTHAEANRQMKDFYSKCLIQEKLGQMVDEIGKDLFQNHAEFISSFIDGLEPKDSTKDEDILGPWRDRFEWRPKSDTPTKEDDEDSHF